ncbi:hypothetical protein ACFOQM_05995 [Paenibacillus sp. GCM10012307]|nr:hypothetical protein [Paenibacillus roseus]
MKSKRDRRYTCHLTKEGVSALLREKETILREKLPWAKELVSKEPDRQQYINIKQGLLKRILKINQMLNYNSNKTYESIPRKRLDLVGAIGSVTRRIEILDAFEDRGEVEVRVRDSMGNEYWTELDDDISLD